MGDFVTYEKIPERAVLIAVASKKQTRERTDNFSCYIWSENSCDVGEK